MASDAPVSRVIWGVPVTVTASENATSTEMVSPILYVPSVVLEVTFETVGAVVSITSALFAPSEPAAPGAASVRVEALPAPSAIVPLLRASEEVAT